MTSILKSPENFLQCQECNKFFNTEQRKPHILPCLHSVCTKCLAFATSRESVKCAECKEAFKLCGSSLDFPTDKARTHLIEWQRIQKTDGTFTCAQCSSSAHGKCMDCEEFLCSGCIDAHRKTKLTKKHHVVSLQQLKSLPLDALHKKQTCSVTGHEGQPFSFFCDSDSCKRPVCTICVVTNHTETSGHDVRNINDVYVENKRKLETKLADMKRKKKSMDDIDALLREELQQLGARGTTAEEDIEMEFDACIASLERRKSELKDKLRSHCQVKKKKLEENVNDIKLQRKLVTHACDFAEFHLTYSAATELIEIKQAILQRMAELADIALQTKPSVAADVKFVKRGRENELTSLVQNFGDIWTSPVCVPNTRVKTFNISAGKTDQVAACVTLHGHDHQVVHESGVMIEAQIKNKNGQHIKTTVKDLTGSQGCYKVFVGPCRPGKYSIKTLVQGETLNTDNNTFVAKKLNTLSIDLYVMHTGQENGKPQTSTPDDSTSDLYDTEAAVYSESSVLSHPAENVICPDLFLDNETCHRQNWIGESGKTITNKKSRRFTPRPNSRCFQNYRGTITTKPLDRTGRLYFEVQTHIFVRRQLRQDLIFEMGLSRKSVVDQTYSVDGNPNAWVVCFRRCAICRTICLQAWHNNLKLYHSPIADMSPPGTTVKAVYGLLDNESKQLFIMDARNRKLLFRFRDIDTSRALWPTFGVYSPAFVDISLTLRSSDDIDTILEPPRE